MDYKTVIVTITDKGEATFSTADPTDLGIIASQATAALWAVKNTRPVHRALIITERSSA